MTQNQVQTLVNEIDWLKDTTIKQGEKLKEMEIRLNKKHEEIVEIKQEEAKKREREMQVLENLTRTSELLNRVSDTLDRTQDEIIKIKEDSNRIKEDIIDLKNVNANMTGGIGASKYLISLFFLVFGGVITFLLTNLLR